MSLDSVVTHLLVAPPGTVELKSGERQMSGDLCTMLADLGPTLDGARSSADPLFTYALPQNLHLAYVLRQAPPVEVYPGFHAPVAAQLSRLDACFGDFIDSLKARNLYDESVIVLTSDHGDSLGEEGRFGHFYAGFPEIFRIPLVVHLPAEMARRWDADLTAVSFASDIAPTLQTLLAGDAAPRGRMFGMPLVRRPGTRGADRRRQEFLLASSYGPVYGLLTENGRRLYVVDAINARDYSFDLTTGAAGSRLTTTAAERRLGQQRIAEQIAEIAAFFDFDAEP
jgi:arylsulfatase A-like enzyme